MSMDDTFDVTLRTVVYRHFATTGQSPMLDAMRETIGATSEQVRDGYRRLYAKRMLVPAGDFASIRMAPPFSGVPTQHRATVNGTEYFANCAWDAFGVVAALGGTGSVLSRCEHTLEPLTLHLTPDGPPASGWLFHCVVPASEWWNDIVFT
jgi:Alkylmercury lyase